MKLLAFAIGLLAMLMALTGLVRPDLLIGLGRYSFSPAGLYVVAIGRLVVGLILFLGARGSRTPRTLRLIGVLVCVAGIAVAAFTIERQEALTEWWATYGSGFVRVAAVFVFGLGAFIAYATSPRRR
jgi:hypothetical protein